MVMGYSPTEAKDLATAYFGSSTWADAEIEAVVETHILNNIGQIDLNKKNKKMSLFVFDFFVLLTLTNNQLNYWISLSP